MICIDRLSGTHYHKWKHGKHCHLYDSWDDVDALHTFDAGLGLKREWFQDGKRPHYDLTQSKRRVAVKMGAIEV